MRVEIGLISKKSISDILEVGGYFPFAIDGNTPYIIDCFFWGEKVDEVEEVENFISNWMNILNQYPMYAFFEGYDFEQEEFERDCLKHSIEYEIFQRKKRDFYGKATITNNEQFNVIFPYLYGNGRMNNFAGWSLEKDVFSLGKRDFKTFLGIKKLETPIITISENTTFFWVGYDGDNVIAISNDEKFSKLSSVISTLPKDISFTIVECSE